MQEVYGLAEPRGWYRPFLPDRSDASGMGYACQRCPWGLQYDQTEEMSAALIIRGHIIRHLGEVVNQMQNTTNETPSLPVDHRRSQRTEQPDEDPFGHLGVFEGIDALLQSDVDRARRVWYPIREDGTFNR